jgi:hypothetical protein
LQSHSHHRRSLCPAGTSSSCDSSVAVATGSRLDGRGSIPGMAILFLITTASRPALGTTQPPIQWVSGALSPGVKQLKREAYHSPSSSAQVKKRIPPLPHTSSWHSA